METREISPLEPIEALTDRVTMTPVRARALRILLNFTNLCPQEAGMAATPFARALWPDAPGWDKIYRCGPKGSHRGTGMVRAGACYLGKLVKAGVLHRTERFGQSLFYVSQKGRENLQAWEAGDW